MYINEKRIISQNTNRTNWKSKIYLQFCMDISSKYNERLGSFSSYLKLAASQPSDSFTLYIVGRLINCKAYF